MFSKKQNPSVIDALIGINTSIEGDVNSLSSVKVEGKVIGNINAEGDVYVGEKAYIKGNVYTTNAYVSCTVEGQVHAKGILHIMSTSRLTGDIEVISFVADEGAVFEGNCKMIDSSKVSAKGLSKQEELESKRLKKSQALDESNTSKK